MEGLKKWCDRILSAFCIFLFSALVVLVTWQVFTRFILKNPSAITEELAKVSFVWLVLFGAAYVFGERGHMNVIFGVRNLSPGAKRVVDIIVEVIIMIFSAFILVGGGKTASSMAMGQMSAALSVSMGYIYLALPISGLLIIFYNIYNIYALVKAGNLVEEQNDSNPF